MYPVAGIVSTPTGCVFPHSTAVELCCSERIFFSIGGGFIVSAEEFAAAQGTQPTVDAEAQAFPILFTVRRNSCRRAAAAKITISQLMLANECALVEGAAGTAEEEVRRGILRIWQVMRECTQHGMECRGYPSRRPQSTSPRCQACRPVACRGSNDPLSQLDWITVYAMAVNEENAAGGRVVTAPTNGAAGVVPAVAHYYLEFVDGANEEGILRYFLTAAAIGILYKENASISGAEVGCQGEVGVACSMAAGGLVAAINPPAGNITHRRRDQ